MSYTDAERSILSDCFLQVIHGDKYGAHSLHYGGAAEAYHLVPAPAPVPPPGGASKGSRRDQEQPGQGQGVQKRRRGGVLSSMGRSARGLLKGRSSRQLTAGSAPDRGGAAALPSLSAPRVLPRGHSRQSGSSSYTPAAPPPRYSDEAWLAERQGHIDQGRMTYDHFHSFCALFAITSPTLTQALFRACRPMDGAAMSFQELLRGCAACLCARLLRNARVRPRACRVRRVRAVGACTRVLCGLHACHMPHATRRVPHATCHVHLRACAYHSSTTLIRLPSALQRSLPCSGRAWLGVVSGCGERVSGRRACERVQSRPHHQGRFGAASRLHVCRLRPQRERLHLHPGRADAA